jgi:hypothetical protein
MKPKLFHRCGIHIPVKNLRETLNYYREKLGFTEEWIWGEKDGGLQRDNMRLLFGEDPVYTGILNNNNNRLNLIWFVENVDEIYKEFQERKIEIAKRTKRLRVWDARIRFCRYQWLLYKDSGRK